MGRGWLKLVLFGFALGFGVFYGLEVATNGMQAIHSPSGTPATQEASVKPTASPAARGSQETLAPGGKALNAATARQLAAESAAASRSAAAQSAATGADGGGTALGSLFSAIGKLLQSLATFVLQAIAALFDSLLG
ncbi:MAG: hypothetical protein J7639_27195 [Paenibacillaceae bacterium]|nr:hypothetical protein [Paenibacillaceae bacterium]